MNTEVFEEKLNNFDEKDLNPHKTFCKNILKIAPGERAVVINGRVSSIIILISYTFLLLYLKLMWQFRGAGQFTSRSAFLFPSHKLSQRF